MYFLAHFVSVVPVLEALKRDTSTKMNGNVV